MRVRRLINNDMRFGHGIANISVQSEACAQLVATRLRLIAGEWFLDTSAGLPYLTQMPSKPVDLDTMDALIRQTIIETEGIDTLDSFELSYDSATRVMSVAASVSTIYNTTENIQVTI